MPFEDGIGISQSNRVTIFIPLSGSHMALRQSPPSWDRYLCVNVIVTHFRGYLKVIVVRVKVMVIVIVVKVWGQIFCWKVLVCGIGS
jgi:hypothetical protein